MPTPTDFEKLNGTGEELTEKQLKWGYWFTTHRPELYKGLIWFLIVFNILLGGYNLYYWGNYFIFGYTADQKMLAELRANIPRSPNLLQTFSAQSLNIGGVTAFPSGERTDALALITNPNPDFIAKIEYSFILNGQKLDTRSSFILPLENKYIGELGIRGSGSIDFSLSKISWQRISPHKISNPQLFKDTHLQFEVTDFKYESAPVNRITFNLLNNSFFGYYRANFFVLLKNYETVIGVEKIVVDNFQGGERRAVSISINPGLNPNNIQLSPDINVFDESVYAR